MMIRILRDARNHLGSGRSEGPGPCRVSPTWTAPPLYLRLRNERTNGTNKQTNERTEARTNERIWTKSFATTVFGSFVAEQIAT